MNENQKKIEEIINAPVSLTPNVLMMSVKSANTDEEALSYLLDQLRSFGYHAAVDAYGKRATNETKA